MKSLAALEMLVHRDSADLLKHYVVIAVTSDLSLVQEVDLSSLPRNWRIYPATGTLRTIGDNWVSSSRSVVLRAPRVMVPSESNFRLNPNHLGYAKLVVGERLPFQFDPHLFRGA